MGEIKCLNCNGILFKTVLLDEKGHQAMDVSTQLPLEHDETDSFFKCPHCSSKNVIIDVKSETGLPQFKISRVKK
jgi:Zn finger protein HypA/HybF involved in hydrogenase expression